MSYGVDEEKGRTLLRSLLCLIFVCAVAAQVPGYQPLTQEGLIYIALTAAPTAVILWALHRGSWPGLVGFCAGTLYAIADVTGALAGGAESLSELALLVEFVGMLARLTTMFCIFRSPTVGQYLQYRRSLRRTRDNVIEIGLFVVASAALGITILWAVNALLHTGA